MTIFSVLVDNVRSYLVWLTHSLVLLCKIKRKIKQIRTASAWVTDNHFNHQLTNLI